MPADPSDLSAPQRYRGALSSPLAESESPLSFSLRQRLVLATAPPLAGMFLRAICATCKHEERNKERLTEVQQEFGSVYLGIWHESLILMMHAIRDHGYHGLASYSFDGELAARLLKTMGFSAIRGSSSRGGPAAIRHLINSIKKAELVGLTLDGPRGPRREAKPGLAIVSVRTGVPVIPVAFCAPNAPRLNSWDKTILPRPFCQMISVYGAPINPADFKGPKQIERVRLAIEEQMKVLHAEIEP